MNRTAFLEILSDRPLLLARNAILNVLQSFSIGYNTSSLFLSYLSAVLGGLVAIGLLWTKQTSFFLAILLASATFTPYHAPTPAHMFGAYVLLAGAAVAVIESVWPLVLPGRLDGNLVDG